MSGSAAAVQVILVALVERDERESQPVDAGVGRRVREWWRSSNATSEDLNDRTRPSPWGSRAVALVERDERGSQRRSDSSPTAAARVALVDRDERGSQLVQDVVRGFPDHVGWRLWTATSENLNFEQGGQVVDAMKWRSSNATSENLNVVVIAAALTLMIVALVHHDKRGPQHRGRTARGRGRGARRTRRARISTGRPSNQHSRRRPRGARPTFMPNVLFTAAPAMMAHRPGQSRISTFLGN